MVSAMGGTCRSCVGWRECSWARPGSCSGLWETRAKLPLLHWETQLEVLGQLIKDPLPWTYASVPLSRFLMSPVPDAPLLAVTPVPPTPSRVPSCSHLSPDPIPIPCSCPIFSVWLPFPYSLSRIPSLSCSHSRIPVGIFLFPYSLSSSTFPFPVPFPYSSSRISSPLFLSSILVLSSYSSSHILSPVAVSAFPLPFPYSVPVPTSVFPAPFPVSVLYSRSRPGPLAPDTAAIAPARPAPPLT